MPEDIRARIFTDPDAFMLELFSSKAARSGGVIRRKLFDVERFIGIGRFRAEIARRGYTAVVNAGQVVVFCNSEPLRRF